MRQNLEDDIAMDNFYISKVRREIYIIKDRVQAVEKYGCPNKESILKELKDKIAKCNVKLQELLKRRIKDEESLDNFQST